MSKGFIPPMLAETIPEDFDFSNKSLIMEEKLDGHRHLVRVNSDRTVDAWSSRLKDATKKMDEEMLKEVSSWDPGIYDGELELGNGFTSSDVSLLTKRSDLKFIVFDILYHHDKSVMKLPWEERRKVLESATKNLSRCFVCDYFECTNRESMLKKAKEIWKNGGEGLIIKTKSGIYEPAKRRKAFMKLKETKSVVGKIIDYKPPTTPTEFGTVIIKCGDIVTSVKVPTLKMREFCLFNYVVGKSIRIDYQNKTTSGTFRHPRWDRFEDYNLS